MEEEEFFVVGCLTSQQQASVSQGRVCTENFTCCHTKIEVADQTFYLTQSQYTDTGPTSPRADPITPGAWQGSHWSANFEVTGMTRPRKNPGASGIRTRDLPLSRRTPYHEANEAVREEEVEEEVEVEDEVEVEEEEEEERKEVEDEVEEEQEEEGGI